VIGPISLSAGNYTLNAVLWQVNSTTGDFTTSVATLDFTVSLPIAEPEKYTPIQVIIVGISFVFLVLGVLAMFTFLSGRLLPQEAPKPVVTTPSDEGERIAAIAAVIKLRGK
jgi:Na+-transporting methylmalonyl-CoA/oxaloacetate decarboxylase gamma subunit